MLLGRLLVGIIALSETSKPRLSSLLSGAPTRRTTVIYHFHEDRDLYLEHQSLVSRESLIPWIEQARPLPARAEVLEIGCGEAGVLRPFFERRCRATGVDLDAEKIGRARETFAEELSGGWLTLYDRSIYAPEFETLLDGRFDLIILKDAIEHLEDQEKMIGLLKRFLRPGGSIFIGFPPWHMPFGGHQQGCRSILGKTPWIHLLPMPLYRRVLEGFGESQEMIDYLMETKRNGISIGRFEKILARTRYEIVQRTLYLVNPIYEYKFGLRPMRQLRLIEALPVLREFATTGVYYLVEPMRE